MEDCTTKYRSHKRAFELCAALPRLPDSLPLFEGITGSMYFNVSQSKTHRDQEAEEVRVCLAEGNARTFVFSSSVAKTP